MAFRLLMGDIWNVAPLCLRGVPNRTAVVGCEGQESQYDSGVERKSWDQICHASQFVLHPKVTPRQDFHVLTCPSLQLPQQTGAWTQAPKFQGTPANPGEGPALYVFSTRERDVQQHSLAT